MSENKRGIALVHEICPICGKPMNGKRINIGTYKTEEEAANVYNNYKNKYIENHANFRTKN